MSKKEQIKDMKYTKTLNQERNCKYSISSQEVEVIEELTVYSQTGQD